MRAILTYHSIDTSGSVISVSPERFARHVHWMATGGIPVMPLRELLRLPDDRHALAITFDDGYTNFAREAWPRLRDHGLPVTLFVPTRFVGAGNDWAATPGGRMPRLPILGWDALATLQEEGVALGAHTRTHANLRALDANALEEEICGSFDDLRRRTGRRADTFAYPYGYWTAQAAAIVRASCACACTTELRPLHHRDAAHLLPRLDVFYLNGPAGLEHFGTRGFRTYIQLRSRLRTLAQRVRADTVD